MYCISCFSLEGIDVSQVPVRPRGRPSGRFFLSSFMNPDMTSHFNELPPLKPPTSFDETSAEATDLRTPRLPESINDVTSFTDESEGATDLTLNGSRRPTPDDVKSCLSEVRVQGHKDDKFILVFHFICLHFAGCGTGSCQSSNLVAHWSNNKHQ